jgi:hypothetical protein
VSPTRPQYHEFDNELGRLRIETEVIDVTTNLPTADKNWRYTDQHGHEHYWQDGYPTLRTVVDEVVFDDYDDYDITHLECLICGEVIKPGLKPPSAFREYIPGRTSYYLDSEPISEEEALEIINRAQTQQGERP